VHVHGVHDVHDVAGWNVLTQVYDLRVELEEKTQIGRLNILVVIIDIGVLLVELL
jgi:hypothetical protein